MVPRPLNEGANRKKVKKKTNKEARQAERANVLFIPLDDGPELTLLGRVFPNLQEGSMRGTSSASEGMEVRIPLKDCYNLSR